MLRRHVSRCATEMEADTGLKATWLQGVRSLVRWRVTTPLTFLSLTIGAVDDHLDEDHILFKIIIIPDIVFELGS